MFKRAIILTASARV